MSSAAQSGEMDYKCIHYLQLYWLINFNSLFQYIVGRTYLKTCMQDLGATYISAPDKKG